jgi:hypothetical protein
MILLATYGKLPLPHEINKSTYESTITIITTFNKKTT